MRTFCFDHRMCIGCEGCSVACKQVNHSDKGQGLRRVRAINPHRAGGLPTYFVSLSCNHCKDPKCMEVCKSEAVSKRVDGIVVLDPDKCQGCRDCMGACPYDAIRFNEASKKAIKCNLCTDNEMVGSVPLCVATCPTGALTICDRESGNLTERVMDRIFEDISSRKKGDDGLV